MKSKNLLLILLGFFLLTNTVLGIPSISYIQPVDGETRVSPDVVLKGYATDNETLTINLTFYNSSNDLLCTNNSITVNTTVGCDNFSFLPYNKEFCWYMNVSSNGTNEVGYSQCFTTRRSGLHIDIDATVTSFKGLSTMVIDLVDVGLDTMIHVLGKLPIMVILLFITAIIIIGVFSLVLGVFKTLGGIFGMFKDLFPKGKTKLK